MNAVIGAVAVVVSLAAAVIAIPMLVVGIRTGRPALQRSAARYAWIILAGMLVATAAMQRALITRDFGVLFVAEHGSSRTPPLFNVATMWSALEGSILLWALILAGYLAIVVYKFRHRAGDPLVGWALVVLFAVMAFFLALMVGPADPFVRFDAPPGFDGPGPNPLLQNHILVAFHPPMLYLGYVGFTVPFAFAIAALATGRLGEGWLLETRRWTLFAWGFLTAGIVLGAWWAYDVLGWGGYWGWDPVENASFLPWLTGTAYIHSVLVQERRGMLRVWNLSLVCATFSLTILGTFITRSGVLASVHNFSESSIGAWLLAFFAATVLLTVGLIYWRGDRLRSPGQIDSPLSREGAFLANNLAFAAMAFIILLGTVFPLIVEAFQDRRISVGVPYFERMTMPVGLTLLFLMAVAPVLPWRKASGELLAKRLEWPAWGGVTALVFAVLVGARGLAPLLGFAMAGFAAGAAVRQLVLATRRQGWRGFVGRANGGMIVHLGVIMLAVGLVASSSFLRQGEFEMAPDQVVRLGDSTIRYIDAEVIDHDNRIEERVTVVVDGEVLEPSLERFKASGQLVPKPATRSTIAADVQVALLVPPEGSNTEVVLRVTRQPMILWLWVGGVVMLFGTALSAFPSKRQRRPIDPVSAPIPVADP
ncbi:MAG: heme lyase CcmF/NrfE family subunit [Acidimicrobiales bacterium]